MQTVSDTISYAIFFSVLAMIGGVILLIVCQPVPDFEKVEMIETECSEKMMIAFIKEVDNAYWFKCDSNQVMETDLSNVNSNPRNPYVIIQCHCLDTVDTGI